MKILFLLFFLQIGSGLFAQDCEIQQIVTDNYLGDAKSLYFNEVITNVKHPDYNNPNLNYSEINKILKIIQAVYNLESAVRDTVFELNEIHGLYCFSFSAIYLKVNTELPEIKNLANNIFPTGNGQLDSLLNKYKLDSVRTSYGYPGFQWMTLYTDNEYNMIPVIEEFRKLPQIINVDFNRGCAGDGNTIKLFRATGKDTIVFRVGKGDCPAGCTIRKDWYFTVTDCQAKYLYAKKNGVIQSEEIIKDFNGFYPNPVIDYLHIDSWNSINKITVYDFGLRKINTIKNIKSDIDLSTLKPGIYFLELHYDNVRKTIKILKQ